MRLNALMDTLIFIILHRCYGPERTGSLLLVAPRQHCPEEEAFPHPALFYKNSVIHLPSCQIKRLPQQEIPPVMIIYSLEHSEESLMSFVTVHFAAICPWNLIRARPYCSWKCWSAQFGVMSLNKSVILREGPFPPPLHPNLDLLINTDVNMQMRWDSMEIDEPITQLTWLLD